MSKNKPIGKSQTGKWWATIIYNDCDITIIDKSIKSFHLPCALSPLHDRDYKEEVPIYYEDDVDKSNYMKEPHYHLMVCFPNSVGERCFRYLLSSKLDSRVHWKGALRVESEQGYGRYLIHLDDLDKAQYRREDILYYGGYDDFILESPFKSRHQKNEDLRLFIQFIHDFGIEDMMTMYEVIMLYCPDKIDSFLDYSGKLERFTRGQYQKELRKERTLSNITSFPLRQKKLV